MENPCSYATTEEMTGQEKELRVGRFFPLWDGFLLVGQRDQGDVAAAGTTEQHHLWPGLKLNSMVKNSNREIMNL